MQFDYYQSPCPAAPCEGSGSSHCSPPPNGDGKPRRRRRKGAVLAVFAALILLLAVSLGALRALTPGSWNLSLDELLQQSGQLFGFFFSMPAEPSDPVEFPTYPQDGETASITIPRAELAPNVKMQLHAAPEQTLSFREIYRKILPSIVSIQAYGNYGSSSGTGVILTGDGYIITNHHIIAGRSTVEIVLYDETLYEAKLVGSDAESDLAVLKIDAVGLPAAEFGDSDLLQVGDTVLAIGNPLGYELFGTMTDGIVSAINRDVNVEGYTMNLIQTTAALNPGNSGGALINSHGQVIGITNMKMMSNYETIEGLGFAIPSVSAKEVVDTLLAQGNITGRPTIGFTCFTVTAEHDGLDGVCVSTVTTGGPADQAGILSGDVIIEANGQAIASLDDLTLLRDEAGVGGTLDLTIWRDGEILNVTLTLVEQYELN